MIYLICGLFFLMGGIEYVVIFLILWFYMKNDFSVCLYFFGFVLFVFSFLVFLFLFVIGRCVDVFWRFKFLLIFCILWEIVGNVMYFMGILKWFLLGSWLVSGLGVGGEVLILVEIGRVMLEEDRIGIIFIFVFMR